MIQEKLDELQETWDFTIEQMNDIEELILYIGCAAMMDSKIRDEMISRIDK